MLCLDGRDMIDDAADKSIARWAHLLGDVGVDISRCRPDDPRLAKHARIAVTGIGLGVSQRSPGIDEPTHEETHALHEAGKSKLRDVGHAR